MSWGRARPGRINGRGIWCHVLGAGDYDRIRDEVDHTRPSM